MYRRSKRPGSRVSHLACGIRVTQGTGVRGNLESDHGLTLLQLIVRMTLQIATQCFSYSSDSTMGQFGMLATSTQSSGKKDIFHA